MNLIEHQLLRLVDLKKVLLFFLLTNLISFENIESTTNISPTVRTRYKMEESSSQRTISQIPNLKLTSENFHSHQNGNHTLQSNEQVFIPSNNRLPSPGLFYIRILSNLI
jgi:hypothetical protein